MSTTPVPETWLPLEAAAPLYGVSVRTLRRRLLAGQVAGRHVKTRNGEEWRVAPPAGYAPPPPPVLVPLADLTRLLTPALTQLTTAVTTLHQVQTATAAALAEAQAEAAYLHFQLATAQAEVARLSAALTEQAADSARLQAALDAAPKNLRDLLGRKKPE